MKEPDPSSFSVRKLRGRNVNEELQTPSIRQLPPGQIHIHSTVQKLQKKKKNIHLPLLISQSTAALVSTVLPPSSSDLDTDQGKIIDEILKQTTQTFNQMLLKTTIGKPISN